MSLSSASHLTRTTGVTTTGAIIRRTKTLFLEFLLHGSNIKFKFYSFILFLFDVIWMISTLLVLTGHMVHWTLIGEVVDWLLVWSNPLEPIHDITMYTIFFITISLVISILLLSLLNVLLNETSESVRFFAFVFLRACRTIFFYPIIFTVLSPLRCSYTDLSFEWLQFHEEDVIPVCFDFPYSLFFIAGVGLTILVCLVLSVDILFLLDKFKSVRYITAGVDGRFLFAFYAVTFSQVLLFNLFNGYEHYVSLATLVLYVILTLYYLRYTPHYRKFYVFLWGNFLGLLLSVQLCFVAVDWSKDYFSFFAFFGVVAILPFINLMLLLRYILIKVFYGGRKKNIKLNFLICQNSVDVGLICSWNKKDCQVIVNILKHKRFIKSKRLVHSLFPFIEMKDRQFCTHLIRHTRSIRGRCLFDTSFAIFFYTNRLSEIHQKSDQLDGKTLRRLRKLTQHELRLSSLFSRLFSMITEQQKNGYSSAFSSVLTHMTYVNKTYLELMKSHPSDKIYRRYANYLLKFHNDIVSANIYFEEAKRLEVTSQLYNTSGNLSDDGGLFSSQGKNKKKNRVKKLFSPLKKLRLKKQKKKVNQVVPCNDEKSGTEEEEEEQTDTETETESETEEDETENVFVSPPMTLPGIDEYIRVDDVLKPEDLEEEPNQLEALEEEEESKEEATEQKQQQDDGDDNNNNEEEEESSKTLIQAEEEESALNPIKSFKHPIISLNTTKKRFNLPSSQDTNAFGGNFSPGGFSDHSEFRKLRKRKSQIKRKAKVYCASYCAQCSVFMTGLLFTGLVIFLFVMTLVERSNFEGVVNNINDLTALRSSSIDVPYYVRKLQTSSYGKDRTPLLIERTHPTARDILTDKCANLRDLSRDLYTRMSNSKEREAWNEIVTLRELYESSEGEDGEEEHVMYHSLFDSAALLSQKCFHVLRFSEDDFRNRTDDSSLIEDEESFYIIEENHDVLFYHFEKLLQIVLEIAEDYKTRMTYTVICVPILMLLFPCWMFTCCVWCVAKCQMRKEIKGLKLIPREEALRMCKKFSMGGGGQDLPEFVAATQSTSSLHRNSVENSIRGNLSRGKTGRMERAGSGSVVTNQTFQTLDPRAKYESTTYTATGGGEVIDRATSITSRWSTHNNKFWCYNMICVMICFSILTLFTALMIVSMNEYHTRNVEYNAVSQVSVSSRHLHFVTTDLLYRDDSIHPSSELLEEFEFDLGQMELLFNSIRRGNEDMDLKGFDYHRMDDLKHLLYENECDFEETDHFIHRLNCTSLSDVFLEYLECYERIESVLTIARNISGILRTDVEYEILQSQDYLCLKVIDGGICEGECIITDTNNHLNSSLPGTEGLLQSKLEAVKDFLGSVDDTVTVVSHDGVYILLIVVMPLILLFGFFFLFLGSFAKMNQYLMTPRSLLYLLSDRVLLRQKINDFLSSQVTRRKVMLFQKDQQRREFVQIVQYSTYSILVFKEGNEMMIVFANSAAHDMLGYSKNGGGSLVGESISRILSPSSIRTLKKWIKKMKKFRRWKKGIREKRKKKKQSDQFVNSFDPQSIDSFINDPVSIRNIEEMQQQVQEDEENKNRKSKYGFASANGHNFRGELMGVTISGDEFRVLVDICYHSTSNKFFCIIENIESSKKREILREAEKQSEKTEKLLRNMLPTKIAAAMKNKSGSSEGFIDICDTFKCVTAIFADICGFTELMERSHPRMIVKIVNGLFSGIDDLTTMYNIEKIKTIGDAYFGVCGLPTVRPAHAYEAMKFSIALLDWVETYNEKEGCDLHMRVGLASGPVIAGVIGKKKWCYDVWGRTINQACRMEQNGTPDKITVFRSTYELVFDRFHFDTKVVEAHGLGRVECYVFRSIKDSESRMEIEAEMRTISCGIKNSFELNNNNDENSIKKKKKKKKKRKKKVVVEEEEESESSTTSVTEEMNDEETETGAESEEEEEEEEEDVEEVEEEGESVEEEENENVSVRSSTVD